MTLPCIVCETPLTTAIPKQENAPLDGVVFESSGNYGSSILDAAGYSVQINVCDSCLRTAAQEGYVMKVVRTHQIPKYEYSSWSP